MDRREVAAALPAYDVGGELGRGAWGVVLAGRHRQLGREVAIKQLPDDLAVNADVRDRFLGEARMLASLEHPHIVPVYDYVDHEGLCLLVMERLSGGSVRDRMALSGVTQQEACALVVAVSSALDHAHQRGVLHRDVKPENLIFSSRGALKVTDFGIAKVLGADTLATRDGQMLGTPAYMAPEQAHGGPLTPATDVYALGTILYELLAGALPFPDASDPITVLYQHVHTQPRPLLDVAPDVPAPLAQVVMSALATRPADRPAGAEAFGTAVAGAAAAAWGPEWLHGGTVPVMASPRVLSAGQGTLSNPPPVVAPPAPRGGRKAKALALAAAAIVAAAAVAIATSGGGAEPPANAAEKKAVSSDQTPKETGGARAAGPDVVLTADNVVWEALSEEPTSRQQAAAAVASGIVWVTGGLSEGSPTTRVEGYDPVLGAWKAGPDLPVALHHHMAVAYRDELVVLGGWIAEGHRVTAQTSDQVFVLRDGAWVELEPLRRARAGAAAAVVGDRIVVVGGQADGGLVDTTEVFDGDSWSSGAPMPTLREHLAATSDETYLYAVGGRELSADRNTAAAERYDPKRDEWESLAPLPTPRGGLGAGFLSGRLVAIGGESPTGVFANVEALDPVTLTWEPLADLPTPRHGLAVTTEDEVLYAIGGAERPSHAGSTPAVEALRVTAGVQAAAWEGVARAPTPRQQVGAAVASGIVWVTGGLAEGSPTAVVEGYDPVLDAWKSGPELPVRLHHHSAVTYQDELVVLGGWVAEGRRTTARESDRVFVLRDGAWAELPPLLQARAGAAAAVVGGRIVVVGGQAAGGLVATTEVFDGTGWREGAAIPSPRDHLAAASDGTYLYAVGGRELSADRNSAAVERYDPAADTWETLPALPSARGGLAAAVLGDRLVAAGGEGPTTVYGTVEALALSTLTWAPLADLTTGRHGLALVTVDDAVYALAGADRPSHRYSTALGEALHLPEAEDQE